MTNRRASTVPSATSWLALALLVAWGGCSPPDPVRRIGQKPVEGDAAATSEAQVATDASRKKEEDARAVPEVDVPNAGASSGTVDAGSKDLRSTDDLRPTDRTAPTPDGNISSTDVVVPKPGALQPLAAQLDGVKLHDDFEVSRPLEVPPWKPIQETRWTIEGGVLKGIPSTPAYQMSHTSHDGSNPVMDLDHLGDYAMDFRFKLEGTSIAKCDLDFDHHKANVTFADRSVSMHVAGSAMPVKQDRTFEVKLGQWYHVLVEVAGDTLVVQFENGPVLYTVFAGLADPNNKGLFRIAGPEQGTVYLDDVTVWSLKPGLLPTWPATRAMLP